MITNSPLSTLEKRELHIASNVQSQIQAGILAGDELLYYEAISSSQDLDDLEFVVDNNQLLLESVGPGTVGLPVALSTIVGRKSTGDVAALSPIDVLTLLGIHHSKACTWIDGTGVAGNDASGMTVKSITLPANTITQVGDRIRIRVYWRGDMGTAITGTTTVNGVTVSHSTDTGGVSYFINEVYLHYIDNTHANIIETEVGLLGALSLPNIDGFDWDSAQAINVDQSNSANNHIVVIAVIVDCFPKGLI